MIIDRDDVIMLFPRANVLWKLLLTNSREKDEGSVESCAQVIVMEPPDVGSVLFTAKFDSAEAKERKKRTLGRKGEKEDRVCKERR